MNKPASPGTLLVVDDDPDILTAAQIALDAKFGEVHTLRSPAELPEFLSVTSIDAVLLDLNFTRHTHSGAEGLNCLDLLLREDPTLSVVCMTAFENVPIAVETMKRGAVDFVIKPWQNEKLVATMAQATALSRSRRETNSLKLRNEELAKGSMPIAAKMVGSAASLRRVFAHIRRAAPTDANVLILGETGTGKELTAREVHRHSARANLAFVHVDMGAVTESLFEAELFGHKRGAFTGADSDRAGYIRAANGGTLFLDEIGNLSITLQQKMLSVLERREVIPVGSNRAESVDIRLVCATNLTATELADPKRFRRDLVYRIKTVEIQLPPLRERAEDVPALLDYFLERFCRRHQKARKRPAPAALDALQAYPWPGNIRELAGAVERAVILAEDEWLELEDFGLTASAVSPLGPDHSLEDMERNTIQRILTENDGNVTHAAQVLGLTRQALYRRLKKFHLL